MTTEHPTTTEVDPFASMTNPPPQVEVESQPAIDPRAQELADAEAAGDWTKASELKLQRAFPNQQPYADDATRERIAKLEEEGDVAGSALAKAQALGIGGMAEAEKLSEERQAELDQIHANIARYEDEGNWIATAEEKAKLFASSKS